MKKFFRVFLYGMMASLLLSLTMCTPAADSFESVKNDPMDVRLYTLDNGLKVYMSVYKDAPRIQTFIGVRAGSKNDPATSTGLAHYFEHLMFKGTKSVGSKDFSKEEPLLNEIEALFELYRQTEDSIQRVQIYRQIDSVSNVASKYAISNEYDRLMALIGSQGSNAWTSPDQTVFVENIPSNELENWAIIEADRFKDPIIRIFHTELETVYEEKNRSLNSDQSRVIDTLMYALYPFHTYGTQSTLGTDKDLKSPSITNIKNFYKTYYVPNNMAVCLAGDFNPDSAIVVIKKYFGDMQSKDIPEFKTNPETPITAPIVKNVNGMESDMVYMGYRLPGAKNDLDRRNELLGYMLYNGTAGLFDLNVNQKQQTLFSGSFVLDQADYSTLILIGNPKEGQSLEEVKDILVAQIDSIKNGNFGDWLLTASINNLKLAHMESVTSNRARATQMIDVFTNQMTWAQYRESFDKLYATTKEEIVDYANKMFNDNYVVVYKHRDPNFKIPPFPKPQITPVNLDRDSKSDFFKQIESNRVTPIEPVFVDYQKELSQAKAENNIPVIYKKNDENKIFSLIYVFDMGQNNDKRLPFAFDYMNYLGTDKMDSQKFKEEMFKLACAYNINTQSEKTFVTLSGLAENMNPAMQLMEDLFNNATPNENAFNNLISDYIKARGDSKMDFDQISKMMLNYGMWGANSPTTYVLSNPELLKLTSDELLNIIHNANHYKHSVWYYGPAMQDSVIAAVNTYHNPNTELMDAPAAVEFEQQGTDKNQVILFDYNSKQTNLYMVSKGAQYNPEMTPVVSLYNGYFGDIAFQELREARGLAYTVSSAYRQPSKKGMYYMNTSFIGTQTDKLPTAIDHFQKLLSEFPQSPEFFEVSKLSLLNNIRTQRITKENVIWSYYNAKKYGLDYDINKTLFETVPNIDFFQLQGFFDQYVKPASYKYCIIGNEKDLDMNYLKSVGDIKKVTLEELFGY
ncbi:MAG: insulinase family protein [Bacteroidales bacterium]|nr:insulinase family protein [Bacteroidales bacterium]